MIPGRGAKTPHASQLKNPEVPASPRGEALFRCARPSGVPRGPATSTGSLASQRHKETSFSVLLSDMSGSVLKTLSQLQSVPFNGSVPTPVQTCRNQGLGDLVFYLSLGIFLVLNVWSLHPKFGISFLPEPLRCTLSRGLGQREDGIWSEFDTFSSCRSKKRRRERERKISGQEAWLRRLNSMGAPAILEQAQEGGGVMWRRLPTGAWL